MKTSVMATATVMAAIAVATAPLASAVQAGNDHNGDPHYWIKVGRNEVDNSGASFVGDCRQTNIMNGANLACDRLVPLLQNELRAHPHANGYWAEWYYNSNHTRSGIW